MSGNLIKVNTSCIFINNSFFSIISGSTLHFTLNTSNSKLNSQIVISNNLFFDNIAYTRGHIFTSNLFLNGYYH